MTDDPKRDAWDARSIRTWFEEEHERAVPEEDIQIVAHCPVLWSGWEGDRGVVLYRLRSSGETGLHVLDGVHHAPEGAVRMLEERLAEYREAIAETEAFLARLERDRLMTEIYQDFEEIGSLGDDDEGEVIAPWGSGNVFTDLGLPDPEESKAMSDWRWLCTECWTEGEDPKPDACPTCGSPNAWYETARHGGRPMKEVYDDLFDQLFGPPKGVTKQ